MMKSVRSTRPISLGVGLQSRFSAILGIDQIHRLALAGGGEKLPVAGGGDACAPEPGHGQCGLLLNHHGKGAG